MEHVRSHAHRASAELALDRGVFPAYRGSRLQKRHLKRRHATVTTIAPTGTISIIANCSPGIEPLYGVHVVRTVMDQIQLAGMHPAFERLAAARGLDLLRLRRDLTAHPSIQHLRYIPQDLRRLFSGVSKTINLPAGATVTDVARAFLLAYRLGCKGVTVFRSGSRGQQVLSCAKTQAC
jgi:ribonucleoside-diphosphate reductase alpha chain